MKKKVLITGVNGFIGGAMWSYLNKRKEMIDIYGIDLTKKMTHPRISVVDLLDLRQTTTFFGQVTPDYIFHMAGGRMNDHDLLVRSNIETTDTLFAGLKEAGICPDKIIIPGSAAEYGLPPGNVRRIHERCVAAPQFDYGRVKLQQTESSLKYVSQGFHVVVARMFNITGANTPEQLAAGRFAKEIVHLEKTQGVGALNTLNLEGRRDFLDIDDICSAMWCLAQSGRPGQIYNVCSSVSVKIEDLLLRLIRLSKLTDVEIREDKNTGSKSFNVIGSNAKLRAHTVWRQTVGLDESLLNTLKSWRKASGLP